MNEANIGCVDADFAGEIVELRVHGVSGTPPEALLGMPTELIVEVSGDNDWRASNLPDCGPNRVRFGKESRSWHENTRNTSPSSVTR